MFSLPLNHCFISWPVYLHTCIFMVVTMDLNRIIRNVNKEFRELTVIDKHWNTNSKKEGKVVCELYTYLHQLAKVKFWSLQDFDFSDENILQGVDTSSCFFNIPANRLRNELQNQLFQIAWRSLGYHNFPHLSANLTIGKAKKETLNIILSKSTPNQIKGGNRTWNTNLTNLTGLGITGSLDLVCPPLCKSNAEHSQGVVVSSLDIHMGLNQCLPPAHQWPQLVSGEVHSLS